ncbi:related to TRL1-tRNA ligase [Serendipita indica DSM 11827]|uniref:tRNA ligase n=1 Tax=Serendipita indica (strain DSM 11827) TaxID=1109443 RepID=G4TAK5_SERID|nr:related to TRL1-tRNA ligase [Serendipita indica DSM 11827]
MAESSQLIHALYALSRKNPKLVKSSKYIAPADDRIEITSWKMNEFKYYDVPSPFPTLARGLFTTENGDDVEGTDVKYRIVARGYDKFFNIGEVPWTNWRAIERHTTAPYTLTLKSNGCIIFIAALSPDKLLVTSKHSLGPVAGAEESHAQVGERWLNTHLEQAGKTREQLAATLWEKNWTAVAELCDDSFEEHVLRIPSEMTGLHLHGLNANVGEFNTQAQPVVDAFAEEWGFIKTASLVLNTEREVREYTQEIGKTGKWNGVPVEGFVVRTTIGPRPAEAGNDTPPYAPGSSFFFKVKFDEPYMMYRDWRELTKALLAAKAKGNIADAKLSKAKLRRKETMVYKQWVEKEIVRNPKAFALYTKGRGIIAVRDRFFEWLATPEGQKSEGLVNVEIPQKVEAGATNKVVIVPVAVPGCGKTTISVALAHLFGFGHTQSDNIKAKKAAPAFERSIVELLKTHDVVIADRNNHLTQHRAGIRNAVSSLSPPPRLIALSWSVAGDSAGTVHHIVTERILSRGDNHQKLTPGAVTDYKDVIWRFLKDSNELAEDEVDDVIEMEVDEDLEDALARAVSGIVELVGLEKPSDEKMGEALRIAREYQPNSMAIVKKGTKQEANRNDQTATAGPSTSGKKEKSKAHAPRYYAIMPEIDLQELLEDIMKENDTIPDSARQFWNGLQKSGRVAPHPHITIVHTKSRQDQQELWSACETVEKAQPVFEFTIGHLVCNDEVMALAIDNIAIAPGQEGPATEAFLQAMDDKTRSRLHITIGTKNPSIPPVSAKTMIEKWKAGKMSNIDVFALTGKTAQGQLSGLFA